MIGACLVCEDDFLFTILHLLVGFLFSSFTLSLRLYTSPAPCSTVLCQRYAECVSTDNATGVCVCPHECPYQRSSVCGSDGKTYINDCHLRVASCRRKANVSVRYAGECSKWRLLFTLIIVLIYQLIPLPDILTFTHLFLIFQSFWFLMFRLRTNHHPPLWVVRSDSTKKFGVFVVTVYLFVSKSSSFSDFK